MTPRPEPEYVEHQIIKDLADRAGELEAEVSVVGNTIRLSGRVSSEASRRVLLEAVTERFPGYEIADDLEEVEVPPAPDGGERV